MEAKYIQNLYEFLKPAIYNEDSDFLEDKYYLILNEDDIDFLDKNWDNGYEYVDILKNKKQYIYFRGLDWDYRSIDFKQWREFIKNEAHHFPNESFKSIQEYASRGIIIEVYNEEWIAVVKHEVSRNLYVDHSDLRGVGIWTKLKMLNDSLE